MFLMFSKPPEAKEKNNNGNEFEQSPGFPIDRNLASATFKIQSSMQRRVKTLVLFNLYPFTRSVVRCYYVINPITKQGLALPPIPEPRSFTITGFIYNNSDNDIVDKQVSFSYRLVMLKIWDCEAHIFSSDTGKWSVVGYSKEFQVAPFPSSAVPYKGLLFWCGTNGRLLAFDLYNSTGSRCFDIEAPIEWEQLMNQPIERGLMKFIDCLGVCQGCLKLCQIIVQSHICVWEYKDYDNKGGGEWCLQHKVSLKEFVSEKSLWLLLTQSFFITVLGFHHINGDILYLGIKSKVLICNLRRKTLELYCYFPLANHYSVSDAFNFVLPCWPAPIPSSIKNAAY
ncbi:F-box protein At3g28330-like [Castanea sativa]|uniref:F-box protein At3g28330-like n=1 Tax=Castanea sativa TaxID=21020 RepID=UPI003F653881